MDGDVHLGSGVKQNNPHRTALMHLICLSNSCSMARGWVVSMRLPGDGKGFRLLPFVC